ncbi:MAG: 3-deoxy-manno-octulosonate cytidylyltransferase [Planctomycetes bacterium]|nr:3-deoxy-manno-octulosonate cytidylyltransferase [Planctomycetota bacterium]
MPQGGCRADRASQWTFLQRVKVWPVPSAIAVIPARYASVRFPGKVLADRTGSPLIQHVYDRVRQAGLVDRVIVATDDQRIIDAVQRFGGEAVMTRPDHPNGTSRIAEAIAGLGVSQASSPKPQATSLIVNVQADEPDIEPDSIDLAVSTLQNHPRCVMATLASPFGPDEDPADPNIVKVVIDAAGCAMYFSRALIPCERAGSGGGLGSAEDTALPSGRAVAPTSPLKHVGMYVYRRDFLLKYPTLSRAPLEQAEQLEQLRVLEHGYEIAVAVTNVSFHGIDTPEQYEMFVRRNEQGTKARSGRG